MGCTAGGRFTAAAAALEPAAACACVLALWQGWHTPRRLAMVWSCLLPMWSTSVEVPVHMSGVASWHVLCLASTRARRLSQSGGRRARPGVFQTNWVHPP